MDSLKKSIVLMVSLLLTVVQGGWAQTVTTESALRAAVETNNANIVLGNDITLSAEVVISDSRTVTIDLNGHTLDRGLGTSTSYGNVLKVANGSMLIVNDSSGNNAGVIKGGYTNECGGIRNEGTLTFNGGTVRDNHSWNGGAGIWNKGMAIINGGVIENNVTHSDHDGKGGGIGNEGTLIVKGGTFQNNVSKDGGAIYNKSGASATISGGTFTANRTTAYGGGAVTNQGTLTVTGGSFTGNVSTGNGGGIYSNGMLNMSGNPVITGNQKGTANPVVNNLYLAEDKVITVAGDFTEGTDVGVTMAYIYGKFTSGFNSLSNPTVAIGCFSSDNDDLQVIYSGGEGYLNLTTQGTPYIERSWNGSQVVSTAKTRTGTTALSGNTGNSNTTLTDGWYVLTQNVTYKKCLHVEGDVNLILADDATLTAQDGIYIMEGKTFSVYAQSRGTGKIEAHSESGPGIGGMQKTKAGHFIVHGGVIDAAAGSSNNAGIGGGNGENSGIQRVTIYGGTVTAVGGSSGAGIGKGQHNNHWENITIYGGHVTAVGGNQSAGIGGGEDRGNGVIAIYGGTVHATGGSGGAGIGGGKGGSNDQGIWIHGGTVTATGGESGAGIGGGEGGEGRSITISGGTIEAKGGKEAAGIGTGKEPDGDNTVIVINGGTVSAKGGTDGAGIGGGSKSGVKSITINQGTVEAVGKNWSAAIGSGCHKSIESITINGGNITARIEHKDDGTGTGACIGTGLGSATSFNLIRITGGAVSVINTGNGAGIGGGSGGSCGTIEILGGEITAGSYNGAGIGSGFNAASSPTIRISGGYVYASSGLKGAGIGGGERSAGGNIAISGGYVTAVGGYMEYDIWEQKMGFFSDGFDSTTSVFAAWSNLVAWLITGWLADDDYSGAGIGGGAEGDGGNVVISGGVVMAKGGKQASAIGSGDEATNDGSLTLFPGAQVWVGKDEQNVQSHPVPAADRVSALQSNCFGEIRNCDHPDSDYIDNEDGLTHTAICKYCSVERQHERHFYHADGKCVCGFEFQELVLHDDADNSEALAAFDRISVTVRLSGRTLWKDGSWNTICLPFSLDFITGTPLEGATVRTLTGATVENGVLTLTFGEAVTTLEACKPYIVKWNSGSDITDPVFKGVTIKENTVDVSVDGGVTFSGSFSPVSLPKGDRTRLFLGPDNQLYYPTSALNINSCRGYFQLGSGINLNAVSSFVIDASEKAVMELPETEE